jgi:uncharacterized membrane protein YeaQ/YmgE (transglycosylase-associated protein family)
MLRCPSLSTRSTLAADGGTRHIRAMTKKAPPPPAEPRRRPPAKEPAGFRSPIRISIDREALASLDKRAIAAQVGVGLAAGWLASWVAGGSGLLRYLITGLVGSLVGGILLERLGLDLGIDNPHLNRIATATVGTVVVILLAKLIA